MQNNKVKLSGFFTDEFKKYDFFKGKERYISYLCIKRRSGINDCIPIVFERDIVSQDIGGMPAVVVGKFRSYMHKGVMTSYVDASEISLIEEVRGMNEITIIGEVFKKPEYRETPLGRVVANMTIKVRREDPGWNDFIPCLTWKNTMMAVKGLEVGDKVKLTGRLQSRNFTRMSTGEARTAYELSVAKVEEVK